MGRGDRWGSPVRTAGVSLVLAVLVLAAGQCLFDHDGDGIDDHGMPQALCWVMLVVPATIPTVSGLLPRGFVVSLAGADLPSVTRLVLDPPPRLHPFV